MIYQDHPESVRKGQVMGRHYLWFAAAQITTGLVLSLIPLGQFAWVREFFVPIDRYFPAFGTMFQKASDPTACKLMLLIWWVVFVPIGIGYWYRHVSGFKAHIGYLRKGRLSIFGYGVLGGIFSVGVVWVHAFHVYEFADSEGLSISRKADLLPWLLTHGPTTTAMWLAAASLFTTMMPFLFLASIRALLFDYAEAKEQNLI